ncbi:hypothetical protein ACWGCC_03685 [Streptomyces nigrescens]
MIGQSVAAHIEAASDPIEELTEDGEMHSFADDTRKPRTIAVVPDVGLVLVPGRAHG